MKNYKKKIIILLIVINVLLVILIIKQPNRDNTYYNNENSNNYSTKIMLKNEIISLINKEDNKSNYEVEYKIDDTTYNRKYLNNKMRLEISNNQKKTLSYYDFENNVESLISEENKIAIKKEIEQQTTKNYITEEILKVINDTNCKIISEEIISNRNAIVLEYKGKSSEQGQFVFSDMNYSDIGDTEYNIKIWIDKESGLLLQREISANNKSIKTTYNLKLNTVTIEDVMLPNLSEYKVTDTTSM